MKNRKNILYFLLVAAVLALLLGKRDTPVSWMETYEMEDKNPYGSYILYDLLSDYMGNHDIEVFTEPLINEKTQLEFSRNTNLIFISENLEFSLSDLEILNGFMEAGNTVFLSAESFNRRFTKEYNLTIENEINWGSDTNLKQVFVNEKFLSDTLSLNSWQISAGFVLDSSFKGTCLAVNAESGTPNFIRIKHGKGQMFVHLNPRAFGNINMIKDEKQASYALSYLPKQDCIWEEYHKTYSKISEDQLTYIRSNQSLRYAFNLSIIAVLLFALFRSKRMQRIIPVIDPPKNESLEFIETIGRLYYDEGKHLDLAEKKIAHFYLYIREKYRLNQQREDFWEKLLAKSGYDEIELMKLKEMLQAFPNLKGISEAFLLRLNNHIDHFYERTGKQYFYE